MILKVEYDRVRVAPGPATTQNFEARMERGMNVP
jgi:hypothetical protein